MKETKVKKLRKEEKRAKGITLIALVITIIVLLILAGVSIATLTGDNGLLTKAQEAKQAQEDAEKKDREDLDQIANMIGDVYVATQTINGETIGNSYNPTIPAGFKPVDTEGASWGDGTNAPSKEAVNAGLVIQDADGNQFVWVPCTTTGEEGLTSYAQDKQYNDGTTASKQYYYTNHSDWTDETGEGNKASVEKYGGFYVARYEAGVPSDAPFYANEDGVKYCTSETNPSKNVNTYTPVSKANNQSWNFISQQNAVTVSENMYAESSSVKSQLIDSYAWDTIMNWMESEKNGIAIDSSNYGNYYNNTSIEANTLYALHRYGDDKNNVTDSWTVATTYKKGNITSGAISLTEANRDQYEFTNYDDTNYTYTVRKEMATGASDVTKVKNIYDMAGNMWEWTTETGNHNAGTSSTQYAVLRGGGFYYSGSVNPVSYRNGANFVSNAYIHLGFRVVLYL